MSELDSWVMGCLLSAHQLPPNTPLEELVRIARQRLEDPESLREEPLMERVEELIRRYVEAPESESGDFPDKIEAVEALEDIHDERVLDFFLRTVADANEHDLARIEILKILRAHPGDYVERERIARTLAEVMLGDPDTLVRTYAAMALARYIDTPGALDAVKRVMQDANEDEDLRFAAFSALQMAGPSERTKARLERLSQNTLLGKSAQRVLSEWTSS